jgi:hypothetical protein
MSGDNRVPVTGGMKFVSLLLIIGGIVGIGVAVWIDVELMTNGQIKLFSPSTAIGGAFIVLFGWAVWTGRDLWRGRRQAITFATILFALQIPAFQIPGFSYEFHTAFTFVVSILSGPRFNLNFNLGSSFTFFISPQIQDVNIGVNLAALFVLIYLMRIRRSPVPVTDNFGLINN